MLQIFKSLRKPYLKIENLPSKGLFYDNDIKIYLKNYDNNQLHKLVKVFNDKHETTLSRILAISYVLENLIEIDNQSIRDLNMPDLYYIFFKLCAEKIDVGYWHTYLEKYKKLNIDHLQWSTKMLDHSTFDKKEKIFNINDWKTSEPSLNKLKMVYDYIHIRHKAGLKTAQEEAQILALISYTSGNNNMTFADLETVFDTIKIMPREEILKTVKILEDNGIRLVQIYDGYPIKLSELTILPKNLVK